ncbi:uncharacterized protein LOC126893504 isoform X2 [Daktulosphaira vitifoliae]|uniref:uncharacterized protein LOC126893504 isoform X2 n=1 Tax=Daktulosphaira vitifoliae TaxID=58002 RepID=UPI0021AA6931|nr:uncharacterized protein LOC126893504 isoform X2 [Daktulosphaira vitifoliae]XP_050519751.1 uncharacterized protein LOC126893504 isoform X2 [Daktulosphaira vitifoliae]XP_050519752.1 uncharacterized protein LOC126893504 isoform X2 [Daktulosphaira vitifoliae]
MQLSNLLYFVSICAASDISTLDSITATMDLLLQHNGWNTNNLFMGINEGENRFFLSSLLDHSDFSTNQNINEKIRKVLLILSCHNTINLMELNDYLRHIGYLCQQININIESFNCLDYLKERVKNCYFLMLPMKSSMLFLADMWNSNSVNNNLPNDFEHFVTTIENTMKLTDFDKFLRILNNLDGNMRCYIKKVCVVDDLHHIKYNTPSMITTDVLKKQISGVFPSEIVKSLDKDLNETISSLLDFHHELGFLYDSLTDTTQVSQLPDV